MSKQTYIGENSSWDIIWQTISDDMDSSFIDEEIRDDISDAYDDIEEVNEYQLENDLTKIISMYYNDGQRHFEESGNEDHIFHVLDRIKKRLDLPH